MIEPNNNFISIEFSSSPILDDSVIKKYYNKLYKINLLFTNATQLKVAIFLADQRLRTFNKCLANSKTSPLLNLDIYGKSVRSNADNDSFKTKLNLECLYRSLSPVLNNLQLSLLLHRFHLSRRIIGRIFTDASQTVNIQFSHCDMEMGGVKVSNFLKYAIRRVRLVYCQDVSNLEETPCMDLIIALISTNLSNSLENINLESSGFTGEDIETLFHDYEFFNLKFTIRQGSDTRILEAPSTTPQKKPKQCSIF
ncbi:unnamed protein product [Moneuplotes crassus]|uniref:Uncharacterized protein n=1 Tax=Euplotes crassus TaxID=5936 RepID=A0AAD1XNL1_EUPCR|nr:unnamed protein product [Moneuplotes crassus]